MFRKNRARSSQPLAPADRFGRIWAGAFVLVVATLAVVLVGKACLTPPP